ncbi:unnamed protein product [Durusdinium trenchii]|uniref:UbiA prenyltransferase domain-containing protein 1 n=1 Tax=Durusdinium trenchii TaxID=1381693 RepID=A0ABP0JFE8_9DINO
MDILQDFLARLAFVGIFIVENVLHAIHFEFEVDNMVIPAVKPLPYEFAVSLHLVHIIFGLFGALFVLVSGFDTAGRTALTKGTSMMLVFMGTITWTWWINRQGVLYWDLDPYPFWDIQCSAEKRNRTVHILKNISIVGALTILQQLAKYESQDLGGRPSFLEGLITALRPWTFPAILGPQLVLLAVLKSVLRHPLPGYTVVFALLVALIAIQAAANLVNSYMDFKKGIDKSETAGDRTLVDGADPRCLVFFALASGGGALWSVEWRARLCFFGWSVVATNYSSTVLGWATLGTCLVGSPGWARSALGYTAGPAPLKYLGLGDLTVLICFGPGVLAYSSEILVGSVPSAGLVLTLPAALYVVAILHANNYRDIEADRRGGARTMAVVLGPKASLVYYYLLLAAAHILAIMAGWIYGCYGSVATVFVLPQSLWLCFRIHRPALLRDQDEETAKTMMMWGSSGRPATGCWDMAGSRGSLGGGEIFWIFFIYPTPYPL